MVFSHTATAQSEYDEDILRLKKLFAERDINAISETYVGVRTSAGPIPDLFPIHSTKVSTAAIVDSAREFLSLLDDTQLLRTQFSVEDPEWRRWANFDNGIYARQGTSLEEMSDPQKHAALKLLSESLSAKGFDLSRNIMKTDQTLRERNEDWFIFGEEKYYLTVMGIPSQEEPWGWQLDGHHLAINFFVLGDQVAATPMFLGGEPAVTSTGKYAGNEVLQAEQDKGLELVRSLDSVQLDETVLDSNKSPTNILAETGQDNLELDYSGISAADLSAKQKENLIELISLFVTNIRDGHSQIRMAEVLDHMDDTYFAWVGATSEEAVFYYRIHSPVILIEFDHQRPIGLQGDRNTPTRQHIHVVVRTPNGNDYGKDYLRQHLEAHPH